jgi:hypothetical protein
MWFLTSREEHRLGVFESRVVRRIFVMRGRKGQGCRRFCSELHDLLFTKY